ncbi:uch2, partial [Symbiodinium microadriaticum]
GEAHHFIAYVPFKGKVYELDGLKTGPIKLGEADSSTWLEVARPAIEARMARYSASETHFALLSLNPKRSAVLQSNISVLEERLAHLEHVKVTQEGFGVVLNDGFEVGTDGSSVDAQISATNEELRVAREDLSEEELKLAKQREENVRRKHNYLPFLIRLVESLAGKGKLAELVSTAQSTATTRAAEKAHVNEE